MKLRSKIPRRKRTQISPILCSNISRSIASSHLTREEVSCHSSRVSANRPQAASLKKRGFADTVSAVAGNEKVGGEDFRRITRSYYRKRESEKVLEVSESSCVESCSGANTGERISELKSKNEKVAENSKEINQSEGFSRVRQYSGKILNSERENEKGAENSLDNNQTEVVSVTSGLESLSEAKFSKLSSNIINIGQNRDELSKVSRNCDTISNSESNTGRIPKLIGAEFDLVCSEHLSYEEACDNEYSSATFSNLQSDVFEDFSSDLDFSDYNSSLWCESGSQFSERSVNGTSPSPTYQLLLQFRQQFCRSSSSASRSKVNSPDEVIVSFHKFFFLILIHFSI